METMKKKGGAVIGYVKSHKKTSLAASVVMGKANPDGSVTAESIQLRPSFPQVAQPAN